VPTLKRCPRPRVRPPRITAEEVAAAKATTLPAFKAAWARLVERGRPLAARWAEGHDPAVGAELAALGREMGRRFAVVCFWNHEGLSVPFMSTRTDGDDSLLSPGADGRVDAGEEHWRRLLAATRFTREQVRWGVGGGAGRPRGRARPLAAAQPRTPLRATPTPAPRPPRRQPPRP
jgi:hypothetical protein